MALSLPALGALPVDNASAAVIGCAAAPYGVRRSAPAVTSKTVALTFDDGPGRSTGQLLHILAANHVTATFFNLGVNEYHVPSSVRAEQADGFALGDHTWDHTDLTTLGWSGQASEMDRERVEQAKLTGAYPCLFRPPYGNYDATTLQLAQTRGMRVWNWSVDTEDWKATGSGATYWINRIKSRAIAGGSQAHPVILMHNQPGGNPATVAALPGIISYYRAHGYTFVDLYGHGHAPAVTALWPTSAATAGGLRMRVNGRDFRGVKTVLFGSTPGTSVRVASPTTLYVTAPAHASGVVAVRVTTTFGTSPLTSADGFRYVAPPTVNGNTPNSTTTAGGGQVRIVGSNFRSVTAVRFGSVAGTGIQVTSPSTLYVTAPAHAAGRVDVKVTTRYGVSATVPADHFYYVARPAVSAISPSAGPVAGGTSVTVTGSSFTGATSVKFGGVAGTGLVVNSPTQLTVVAPPGSAGSVDVKVTTPYGVSAAVPADGYSYVAPPAVTMIAPDGGPAAGGTSVTLTGSGFTDATSVTFGGVPGTTLVVDSPTQLTVSSPPGPVGPVDVVVTTPYGSSPPGTSFTYS